MATVSPLNAGWRQTRWPWKMGLVVETAELSAGIGRAIADAGGTLVFEFGPAVSPFEMASAMERDRPDILFVELARVASVSKPAAEWIAEIRRGEETPLVVAVHATPEPEEMISAVRAGASEFLCLPVAAGIGEAMERIGAMLESRRTESVVKGRISGVLSAKGGCGATSIACYLAAAQSRAGIQNGLQNAMQNGLQNGNGAGKILIADLDYQAPAAHHVLRLEPRLHAGQAFDSVRHMTSGSWREFVTTSGSAGAVDLLASPAFAATGSEEPAIPEQWRVESLFRFASRQYGWILADLGRHLNPANWMFLQSTDELYIVTVPDVLALYQTRAILQKLSSRGFDKSRIRMILNRNLASPQDFWVESIEQMFEIAVFAIVPNDLAAFEKRPRNRHHCAFGSPCHCRIDCRCCPTRVVEAAFRPSDNGADRQ